MKNVFISDFKEHVLNIRFLATVVVLFGVLLFVSHPYVEQLRQDTSLREAGAAWINVTRYGFVQEYFLMGVAVLSPISGGSILETELKNRFIIFSLPRSNMRKYILSKYINALLSGAMGVFSSCILFSVFNCILFAGYGGEVKSMFVVLLLDLLRLALYGGAWAIVGSIGAVLCGNIHVISIFALVLYYVPTVFQQRYYRKLHYLSPKEWGAPIHFSNIQCIGGIVLLLFLFLLSYTNIVRRRVRNV